MTPISFKASYIKPSIIERKNSDGSYSTSKVSFVKLNPKNKKDMNALGDISYLWGKNCFAGDIYNEAKYRSHFYNCNKNFKIYALTLQKTDFKKLNSDDILGITQVEKVNNKENNITYLDVNPKCRTFFSNRKVKHVGTSILNSLKSLYPQKILTLYSVESAVDFYKKNQFIAHTAYQDKMFWSN